MAGRRKAEPSKRPNTSTGRLATALIISDVSLYREGLTAVLESTGRIKVVRAITKAALDRRPSPFPDLLLIDTGLLSGRTNLLESDLLAGAKIIAFSVTKSEEAAAVAESDRLSGFLGSDSTTEEIISMIEDLLCKSPSSS